MRLREIKKILEENIPNLDVIKFIQDGNLLSVHNYPSIYQNLKNIREIEVFAQTIDSIFDTEPFQYNEFSVINVVGEKYNLIYHSIQKIKTEGMLLIGLLNGIVKEQDKNTFSFKLYEFDSLEEYRKFCDDLQSKILDPLNRLTAR